MAAHILHGGLDTEGSGQEHGSQQFNLEHPCLAASHRWACRLGREAFSSSEETVTAAKTGSFLLKSSLSFPPNTKLAQGLLTSQKDVTAALGHVQQGITALAERSS